MWKYITLGFIGVKIVGFGLYAVLDGEEIDRKNQKAVVELIKIDTNQVQADYTTSTKLCFEKHVGTGASDDFYAFLATMHIDPLIYKAEHGPDISKEQIEEYTEVHIARSIKMAEKLGALLDEDGDGDATVAAMEIYEATDAQVVVANCTHSHVIKLAKKRAKTEKSVSASKAPKVAEVAIGVNTNEVFDMAPTQPVNLTSKSVASPAPQAAPKPTLNFSMANLRGSN